MQIFSETLLNEPLTVGWEDLGALLSPILPADIEWPPGPDTYPWYVVRSKLLGEDILLVCEKDRVREAELHHPGLTTYVLPEMEILGEFAEDPERIRTLHRIKKEMKGWLVRPKR